MYHVKKKQMRHVTRLVHGTLVYRTLVYRTLVYRTLVCMSEVCHTRHASSLVYA